MHLPGVYTDQSPDALRLTLVNGDLDMSQFMRLASTTVSNGQCSVTATVIGASHVITYRYGTDTRHEIFACNGYGATVSRSLDQLVKYPLRKNDHVASYDFRVERVPWSDPEPLVMSDLMTSEQRTTGMTPFHVVQEFPQGDCLVTPKTVIKGHIDQKTHRINISTAHSYPNVRGLVLSFTTLSYRGGKQ